jgi:hypothetical protein
MDFRDKEVGGRRSIPVGTIPPWSSVIPAEWRQGLIVERDVLGEEEEKI